MTAFDYLAIVQPSKAEVEELKLREAINDLLIDVAFGKVAKKNYKNELNKLWQKYPEGAERFEVIK